MNDRYEFLEKLRQSLIGRVDAATLEDTLNYYQEYFEIQMRSGKSEQEILEQLGDPRLLARTIRQANSFAGTEEEDAGNANVHRGRMTFRFGEKKFALPGWLIYVLSIAVIVLVIWLVVSALWVLLPVILVISASVLLFRILRDLFSS